MPLDGADQTSPAMVRERPWVTGESRGSGGPSIHKPPAPLGPDLHEDTGQNPPTHEQSQRTEGGNSGAASRLSPPANYRSHPPAIGHSHRQALATPACASWPAARCRRYLIARGDTRTAPWQLARYDLRLRWSDRLGDDHQHTLAIGTYLGWALEEMGRWADARDLVQEILDRRRRILGQDHPDTLTSAYDLASNLRLLGEVQAARDLDQDILDRRRRVLGEDHPETLRSASQLAMVLALLGEAQAARDLAQDTLDRCRRVLGEDHPDTLDSLNNLGVHVRLRGEPQAARDLDQDAVERKLRVLGEDPLLQHLVHRE